MSEAIPFVEFLFELGARKLVLSRSDGTLAVAVVELADGRKLLAIERTYREGICVIFEPTDEELEIARGGDLWALWNSERARSMWSLDGGSAWLE